jgi:hypothetical protein
VGGHEFIEVLHLVLAEEKAMYSAVAVGQGKADDLAPVVDAISSGQTAAESSKILHFPIPVEEGACSIAVAGAADDLAAVVDAPHKAEVITFEDAKIPDGAADIENGVLLGTVDGADKGIDSDLPRIVDAKGGAEARAVANPNSQIRHWAVPVEKGVGSGVAGKACITDDLPLLLIAEVSLKVPPRVLRSLMMPLL